jgi:hypothetical protein
MSLGKARASALLLASALALAVAPDALARGGGGGGGGGGGHFGGGGGGHFGGGGFGGGGFGGMRMGGGGFGGMRMGGGGFGGMRMGGGGIRYGAGTASHLGSFHFGGRTYSGGNGLGAHHFAGSTAHGPAGAGRAFGHAAAAGAIGAGAGHFAGRNNFAHAGFGRGAWRGPFPRFFPGFRGWWGWGWYGPVFWPFAYDVLFADMFWPWAYDYPFWGYGYPDLYGAVFWPYGPYGYDDLAGYLPPGPGPVGGAYAGATPAEAGAPAIGRPSTRLARRNDGRQAEVTGQIKQMCGEDSKEVAGWPIDRIEQAVTPTEDQRHLLDDFANASIGAAQAIKETCPTTVSFAPTGRLDAMQKRIEGMAHAIQIVAPPLDKFYASLTDEQKARLNAASEQTGKTQSLANCGAAGNATQWPGDRIEKAVRPDAQQQAKLDALKTAMADSAEQLAKSCPTGLPATPPARLTAITMRLDTMLASVKNVRGALDDFYNSLNDEQKAQFNLIGRQQQAAQKQSALQ